MERREQQAREVGAVTYTQDEAMRDYDWRRDALTAAAFCTSQPLADALQRLSAHIERLTALTDTLAGEHPNAIEPLSSDDCEDCEHYLTPWKCNGGTEESPCPALSSDDTNVPASDTMRVGDDSLASLIAAHRAKAEAAVLGRQRRGLICSGSKAEVAHIAANDPATVLALLDVVEAAERRRVAEARQLDYTELCPPDDWIEADAAIHAALDRLKEVLR